MLRKLWLLFCWGLLLFVVLTAAGGVFALYHLHSQLRQYVLSELQDRFPELDISLDSVRLDEMKGITICGIDAAIPAGSSAQKTAARPLLHIREVFIDYPVTLQGLYRRDFRFRKIVCRNPVFRITRNADGQFEELQRLFPHKTPELLSAVPVEITGGTLLYDDQNAAQPAPLKITGVDLTLTPQDTDHWQCTGKADGDIFRRLNVEGQYNTKTKHWQMSASCRQLDWLPGLLAYFPYKKGTEPQSDYADVLETFQGRFDLTLAAAADAQAPFGFRFALEGLLSQGRADFREISRTLTELNTKFCITENSVSIEKLTGMTEAARLVCSYHQNGLPVPNSASLTASLRGLVFDKAFVAFLNPFLNDATEQLLSRYEYAGTTDLDAEISYNNGSWKPKTLQLHLADLSFLFKDFPYKVERLTGSLNIDEDAKLGFHLVTKPGETVNAEITGDYADVFRYPVGEVRIRAGGIPIDRKLMDSFPKQHREAVESLHPAGKVNALLRIIRPADGLPLKKEFEIGLDRIALQYEKFPYKLRDVCGVLRLDGDCWTFRDVIGTNGSSAVRCEGHLRPVPAAAAAGLSGNELLINAHAEELSIDEQLYEAVLSPNQRELLTNLNVKGKVNLDAQIQFLSLENQLNLRFRVIPCAGLSMRPIQFPYKIDNVRGEFYYDNGNIAAKRIEAENRDTKIQTGLECQFAPDGAWVIRLQPLTAERLISDRELHEALPENLRVILETLQIVKPVNLNGSIEFSKQKETSPLLTVWNINVLLHQNSISAGVPLENIFGEVQLSGFSEGNEMQLAGEFGINSVTVKGFQTTDVKGPFFFDGRPAPQPRLGNAKPNYLFFGQQAGRVIPPPPNYISGNAAASLFAQSPWFRGSRQSRPVQGKFFNGTLLGEGLAVIENGNFTYSINSALYGADLAKIAKEAVPNANKFTGTLNCLDFHFHGSGTKLDTVGGSGKIQLRNANIFEAPGMVRILRELSVRETDPDAGTFREADIDFRLMGNQVQLNRIELEADAFYLQGNGSMRLDTQTLELAMKTRLGSRRAQIPVISSIIGGAGDQFIQLNVHGPISDPAINRVALPEIQKALQQIQDEAGGPPQVNSNPQPQQQHGIFNRNRPF